MSVQVIKCRYKNCSNRLSVALKNMTTISHDIPCLEN